MSARRGALAGILTVAAGAASLVGCFPSGAPNGSVVDAGGSPVSSCQVAVLQLRDADGDPPAKPMLCLTSTAWGGGFELPMLVAGTHLLIAVEPLPGHELPADAVGMVTDIAAGAMPEGFLVGRALLSSDGSSSQSGLTIRLPNAPGAGRHLTGKLTGCFDPARFVYSIRFSGQGSGPGPVEFLAVPEPDGRFDLGWVPELRAPSLFVEAGPEHEERLYYAMDVPPSFREQFQIEALDLATWSDREIRLPFHTRVPIRIVGAPSFSFPDFPWVNCRGPGPAGDRGYVIVNPRGEMAVLREGEYVFDAAAKNFGLNSPPTTVRIEEGNVPSEIVLDLGKRAGAPGG